jgi:hypothetical protein
MVVITLFILPFLAYICWMWVEGIDYMHKNHPDYKGEDLFGKFNDEN